MTALAHELLPGSPSQAGGGPRVVCISATSSTRPAGRASCFPSLSGAKIVRLLPPRQAHRVQVPIVRPRGLRPRGYHGGVVNVGAGTVVACVALSCPVTVEIKYSFYHHLVAGTAHKYSHYPPPSLPRNIAAMPILLA